MKLLLNAIESSVADNCLEYAYEGYELDTIWQHIAKDLCDDFPDIESIMPIDAVEKLWKDAMERRGNALKLLASVDGEVKLVKLILIGTTMYTYERNSRDMIKAANPEYITNSVFAANLRDMRISWNAWFLKLKDEQRTGVVKDFIRHWRRSSNESF